MTLPFDGYLDSNVLIHSLARDAQTNDCIAFLQRVEAGEIHVRVESFVVHEMTYAIPRYRKEMSRANVADLLDNVLRWPGVVGDIELFRAALSRWRDADGLAFADAILAELAVQSGLPVFTKNVNEIRRQGAHAPDPLSTWATN